MTSFGEWLTIQPMNNSNEINGNSGQDMLKMCFGETEITGATEVEGPDSLRKRGFYTGTLRILFGKSLRRFPFTRRL